MTAFGEQVIALLDELGAEQAVVGGTSLGANVALEVACLAPERVRGLIAEMPVLDNALEAGILAFAPLLFLSRFLPLSISGLRARHEGGAPRRRTVLGRHHPGHLDQRPAPMAAAIHGIFFGRIAPSSRLRRRIEAPALVVGHPRDPIHPAADAAMLAEELPDSTFVEARGILEWRLRPERLDAITARVRDPLLRDRSRGEVGTRLSGNRRIREPSRLPVTRRNSR